MATLPLTIEYHSGIPVYRQIINAITSAVAKAYRQLERAWILRALELEPNG